MGATPDQLKAQIDRTRAELTDDVDVLAEKVSPGAAAKRTTDRARQRLATVKDSVMGSAESLRDSASSAGGSATGSVADTVSGAPDTARQRTQGSPLSAGLIAFGIGALAAAALPASKAEQRAAAELRQRAEPMAEQAKRELSQHAQEIRGELEPQVQAAVQDISDSAREAAQDTAGEARDRRQDVSAHARGAAQDVRA